MEAMNRHESVSAFADYSLPGAPVVARIFLPFTDSMDESECTSWGALLEGTQQQLTADADCLDVLDWAGSGAYTNPWRPASGRATDAVIDLIAKLLIDIGDQPAGWTFEKFPELGDCLGRSVGSRSMTVFDFGQLWRGNVLPGSLRLGTRCYLTAPSYADSIIVSGPCGLIEAADTLGLEIRQVDKNSGWPSTPW